MDDNELQEELKAISYILEVKPFLRHNPLSEIEPDTIKKALNLIEEYSEEITKP